MSEQPQNASMLDTLLKQQNQIEKIQAIVDGLLSIKELDITQAGDKTKVLNLELVTEYPNSRTVSAMVKNETWRRACQQLYGYPDINEEKIVGTMDTQYILKMNSNKRKRAQEFVNAIRNEQSGTEVIQQRTRQRRFLGLMS